MSLVKSLQELFEYTDDLESFIEEKYSSFSFKRELKPSNKFEKSLLNNLINNISDRDRWLLSISISDNDPILFSKAKKLDDFYSQLEHEWNYIEDERIEFNLEIFKRVEEGIISVYLFSALDQFFKNQTLLGFLRIIDEDLKKTKNLFFLVQEGLQDSFFSKNIHFFPSNELLPENKMIRESEEIFYLNEFCDFNYQQEYFFKPSIFKIIKEAEFDNSTTQKLINLTTVFSFAGIFDILKIEGNKIEYKINGYKVLKGDGNVSEITKETKKLYIKIWDWIYSNKSKISDKIGLVRNILTIYLSENSLEISDNAFFSIKSGYRTYLQNNIERYIEVRNRISEQLIDLTNNINTSVKEFLESYQKSNLLFLSFFISVFIIRVLNTGSFTNVFTKDATILSVALLGISLLYLLFSLFKLNAEKARFEKKYLLIKKRFSDLLIEDDINKILSEDEEFNDEIDYIKAQRLRYTVLWLLTLFILLAAVLNLSTALN